MDRRKDERRLCQVPVKIKLPIWDEEDDDDVILEISGMAVNISNQGLALEILDENPSKSRYSNILWEEVLRQESLTLELLRKESEESLTINGMMTWHSGIDLETDSSYFLSDSPECPKKYQLGFHYDTLDDNCLEKIKSFVFNISSNI